MSSTTTFDWPRERRWNRRRDAGTRARREIATLELRAFRLVAWAVVCGAVTGVAYTWVLIK
jgi:hypothetical protein